MPDINKLVELANKGELKDTTPQNSFYKFKFKKIQKYIYY